MQNLSEFLSMNGHGAYIWPAYLIAAAVLAGLFTIVKHKLSINRKILNVLESERQTSDGTEISIKEENKQP